MKQPTRVRIRIVLHFFHKHFLWLLIASYALATFWPSTGLWLRSKNLGELTLPFGGNIVFSSSMLMLSMLLFNAGMGMNPRDLKGLVYNPLPLLFGLIANLIVPAIYVFCVSRFTGQWPDPTEAQSLLMGLALIAAMPIANSSTAWTQVAGGNLALSLGLVLCSTLLSPLTTPWILHWVGYMAEGNFRDTLHELASEGASQFILVTAFLPALLGVLCRGLLGGERVAKFRERLRTVNLLTLILLNYSNASLSLPQVLSQPNYKFLTMIFVLTASLSACAFFSGWVISRIIKSDNAEQSSLIFGLGMNNNGTGLVLASHALASHPLAMLPIIFHNLIQNMSAGIVQTWLSRRRESAAAVYDETVVAGPVEKLAKTAS